MKRQPIFKYLAPTIALVLGASTAFGYTKAFPEFHISNPQLEAKKANSISILKMGKVEWSEKASLIRKYLNELVHNSDSSSENSYAFQVEHASEFESPQSSWIMEVEEYLKEEGSVLNSKELLRRKNLPTLIRELLNRKNLYTATMEGSHIDLAKKIAKKMLYYKIIAEWSCRPKSPNGEEEIACLNHTVFNPDDIPDDASRETQVKTIGYFKRLLETSFVFLPHEPGASPSDYVFGIQNAGQGKPLAYVTLDRKTLTKGRISFQTETVFGNKLPPEAKNIKDDGKGSGSTYTPEPDTSASSQTGPNPGGRDFPVPPPTNGTIPGPDTFNDDIDF